MMSRPVSRATRPIAPLPPQHAPPPPITFALTPPPQYERHQPPGTAAPTSTASSNLSNPPTTTATQQPQNRVSTFPARRPLQHKLQAQIAHQHTIQQRLLELQTSPSLSTFSAAAPTPSHTNKPNPAQPIRPFAGSFLDKSWRGLNERIHTELVNIHSLYAHALYKEQKEKEVFKRHCLRLRGERDVARDRLRRMMGPQYDDGTSPADNVVSYAEQGVKRGRENDGIAAVSGSGSGSGVPGASTSSSLVTDDAKSCDDTLSSPTEPESPTFTTPPSYSSPSPPPPSPTPPESPIVSPLLRSVLSSNSEPLAEGDVHGSRAGTRGTERRVMVSDDESTVRLSKRRRVQRMAAGASADEADMDLGTDYENNAKLPAGTTSTIDSRSSMSPGPGSSLDLTPNTTITTTTMTTTTNNVNTAPTQRVGVRRNHVDLMYIPVKGKLVCRVCAFRHDQSRNSGPPKIFMRSATWEELTDHCERNHPAAFEEVAGMGPGEVMELRQQMAMVDGAAGSL